MARWAPLMKEMTGVHGGGGRPQQGGEEREALVPRRLRAHSI